MISGYVCVKDAIKLDYCVSLAIESLIPVCTEVVCSFVPTDDGTVELLAEWCRKDSRVRMVEYKWDNPHRDIGWWVRWLNWTREQLHFQFQLTLDADEVLDPSGYHAIRESCEAGKARLFHRWNYWGSIREVAPTGRCCGVMVARLGPADLYMPSDEPNPAVHPNVRTNATEHPDLHIHHFGFLRHPKAFLEKSRIVQQAFFGNYDYRLEEAETKGLDWRNRDYFDGLPLEPAKVPVPGFCRQWLTERGYNPDLT